MELMSLNHGVLLEKITLMLRTRFNGLRCQTDWRLLFNHLLERTDWTVNSKITSDILLDEVFGGELVNATVLLFQSLCKIRFGFLDGQARIMALYHFSRKVYPGLNNLFPLMQATQDIEKVKKNWSLMKTGQDAICTIVHGPKQGTGGFISQACVLKLNDLSKTLPDHLIYGTRRLKYVKMSSLSDCIRRLKSVQVDWMYTEEADKQTQSRKLMDLSRNLNVVFMAVLKVLVTFDPDLAENLLDANLLEIQQNLTEEQFLDHVYGQRTPTPPSRRSVLFPSLHHRKSGVSYELIGLMTLLGCAKVDELSMLLLESCINKQWIVQIVNPLQVGGVALSDLHLGTFVNESIKEAWYFAQLYAVSR